MTHNSAYDHMCVVTDNAVNYWRLDTDGDELHDLARPAGHSGSTSGAGSDYNLLPATNNLYSNRFNSSNSDYISFDQAHFSNFTGADGGLGARTAFSIEAWIRPNSDQSATDVIAICGQQAVSGLYLAYGVPTFYTYMQNGTTKNIVSASSAVSTGSVYHLVGTFEYVPGDPNKQKIYLYVNGSQVANLFTTTNETTPYSNYANFTIGSWDTSTCFFDGYISNVAIYGGALNSTKVSNHYSYSG